MKFSEAFRRTFLRLLQTKASRSNVFFLTKYSKLFWAKSLLHVKLSGLQQQQQGKQHINECHTTVIGARINGLVSPCGMKAETYINSVINYHGYLGLAKGIIVLPPGTLDSGEYLRVMKENNRKLLLAEQMEKELTVCPRLL